jgi:NADPH:quinone reductase-like Zn-dependent oxidoreductase
MAALPAKMRGLQFSQHGTPDVLEVAELAAPRPGPDEVLLRVRAAGVNPVDVGIVAMPLPFVPDLRLPAVPGWDVAGEVVMCGRDVTDLGVDDEVFGLARFPLLGQGTFAEYAAVPAADLAPKPAGLPWDQAGALPLVSLTALQAFEAVGGIKPGSRVLIEAAAGGVGHVAAQIAKAAGAAVIGTASSPRHEFLRSVGVDEPVDYTATDNVFGACGPVHGALLSTTTDAVRQAAEAVESGGFLVSISPDIPEDIAAIADQRGVRHASILVAADGTGMRQVARLVSDRKLRADVAGAHSLGQAAMAFDLVKSRRTAGKIVLVP